MRVTRKTMERLDTPFILGKSMAEKFFDAEATALALQGELEDALLHIAGVKDFDENGIMLESIPCENITFDYYDCSFEFKKTKLDWKPTEDMLTQFWELGFDKCWICYEDGSEQHYQVVKK